MKDITLIRLSDLFKRSKERRWFIGEFKRPVKGVS